MTKPCLLCIRTSKRYSIHNISNNNSSPNKQKKARGDIETKVRLLTRAGDLDQHFHSSAPAVCRDQVAPAHAATQWYLGV